MKHTPTVAEDSENIDLSGRLVHVAEEHSFEPTEHTALTIAGECPHCGEEVHASRKYAALLTAGVGITGLALLSQGYANIGVLTMLGMLFWTIAIDVLPERLHGVLSRVGL